MSVDNKLCYGCGIIDDNLPGMGIIAMINSHSCRRNTFEYKPRRFKIEDLRVLCGGKSPLHKFADLIESKELPHFNSIKKERHPMDRNNYRLAREWEIKYLNRMINYIKLEEDLFYSY